MSESNLQKKNLKLKFQRDILLSPRKIWVDKKNVLIRTF